MKECAPILGGSSSAQGGGALDSGIAMFTAILDRRGTIRSLSVSPHIDQVTGFGQAHLEADPGLLFGPMVFPADRHRVAEARAAGHETRLTYRLVSRDGDLREVLEISRVFKDRPGTKRLVGVLVPRCACHPGGSTTDASGMTRYLHEPIIPTHVWEGLGETATKLLSALADPPGAASTFTELEVEVWGSDHREDTGYLRTAIHRLRNHLDATCPDVEIESIRGVGYRLKEVSP